MARNWSAANKRAVDLGLFGNEFFENGTSSQSQIVDEGEAKLVAGCLDLGGLVTSSQTSLPQEAPFPVASIKQEAMEDEDWAPIPDSQPQPDALENTHDFSQVSTAQPKVEESELPGVPKAERDALDDEIDAWLNWRPSGKILLTDSDKKRQKNRMRFGLKSSDVDVLLRICKGCKRCDLACLKSGLTTRLKNTSSKLLLRKSEGGLQGATRRLNRRSLRGQADYKSGIGHIGISRPRTRSQLTNLKGKVDFLEQTSLENSSIKVLRSRSFFLPKVSKDGQKPKLRPRSSGSAKAATGNEQPSQQGKSPTPRRKSRSQIWLTKRRRAKQRKTLTTGRAESADSSRSEPARKTRVKTSRWDDFIRRQREAFQQFQGDGTVSTVASASSSSGGTVKPSENEGGTKTRAERNLFDRLKGKPLSEKAAAGPKKSKLAEKQIKEAQAVFKTRGGSKLGKIPGCDGDSYMDSELSSVETEEKQLRRGRTVSTRNVKEAIAKALLEKRAPAHTAISAPATAQNPNTSKTTAILKGVPSSANMTVLQVTQKPGQGGALSVPLSTGRMPLYIPINYQGRTLLCPVIPASGDSLKYTVIKTCADSSVATSPSIVSPSKTETTSRTNTVNTTPTLIVSPTVVSSSNVVAQSTAGTTAAPGGAKKNMFTIALQPQGGQAKLKTILPMPADAQGQKFPQLVLLKQPPISSIGKDSRSVMTVSSVVLNGKSSVVVGKGNSLVESSTKGAETQPDVTTTCTSPEKLPLASSGKPVGSTQTTPISSLVSPDGSKPSARVQAGKDAILIPISPVMPGGSLTSTSLNVSLSNALQNALGKGTVLRPVYVFGGSGTQLIQSGNIRLGVPVTISPTKVSETLPATSSSSAKKLFRPLQPRLPVDKPLLPTVTTAAATTTTTTTTNTVFRNKGSKEPLLSPPPDSPDEIEASKDDLTSIKAQILLLKEKRRQLRKTRSLIKRSMRRRQNSKSDVFSTSSSSNETSSSESAEFDSDMLAVSDVDSEASKDNSSNHIYNTRLRTRQNKLKFVRTSGNNWKVVHVSIPKSVYDDGDFDSEVEELENADFSDGQSQVPSSTVSQATPATSAVAISQSGPMPEGISSPPSSSTCTLKPSVPPQNAPQVSSQGPKVVGQGFFSTSTLSRPISAQTILATSQPSASKACAKTVATTATLSCQQPVKTLTPPFNALLVKQPDGTFKLQILQPLTPAALTASSSSLLPNSSSLPSSIEISDTLITLSSTSLSILKGPIKEQESSGGSAATSTTTTSCKVEETISPLVTTRPLVIASPQKTHCEADANRSPAIAASSASQITKISAATDQLRKILQRKSSLEGNQSTPQGSCATLKLGDISDHVYAKSKPRRQRRRKGSESKKRRGRSGRRRPAERIKSETSLGESHLDTECGQMSVATATDIDLISKQDDLSDPVPVESSRDMQDDESSHDMQDDESELNHERDRADAGINDVPVLSPRERNAVGTDFFSHTSLIDTLSSLERSNDTRQVDGWNKSNAVRNHVNSQGHSDRDTRFGEGHQGSGREEELVLKPIKREPDTQDGKVNLSLSEHYQVTSKVYESASAEPRRVLVSDNEKGLRPSRIHSAPLKEHKTASSSGIKDTSSDHYSMDNSRSGERVLNLKVANPSDEYLVQSRDSCFSSVERHPRIESHDMTEVDLEELVFGEENGFDTLAEASSTTELEEEWVL